MADPIAQLVNELCKLPGIGDKTAHRLTFHILKKPKEEIYKLIEALNSVADNILKCEICCNLSSDSPCSLCTDNTRIADVLCVVESVSDLKAIERIHEFRGGYHILHGLLSPLDGIGPNDIHIKELLQRLASNHIKEVIVATNPTIEGEATAMYLSKLIRPLDIRVTRLATGLPVGGELDYLDQVTITRAFKERKDL